MPIPFYKYQGAGNDFVIFDNRQSTLPPYIQRLAPKLCNRCLGIGADGLILLQNRAGFDFEMVYYNADGSTSLCGNGSRCVVHLARHLGIIDQEAYFLTNDGPHQARFQQALIRLKMHDVEAIQRLQGAYFLDNGAPHYIKFVEDLTACDVYSMGKAIRDSAPFEITGTNVNFVQTERDNTLRVRTYERGVEGETLSCGTGATAAALVAATKGYKSPVKIIMQGGTLQVHFVQQADDHFQEIYLTGPAEMTFQGTVVLADYA